MSIWDHKNEVKRLLDNPEGTKVWIKHPSGEWSLISAPQWYCDGIYIVDDKHAEIRKEWLDKGKPQVQYKSGGGNWKDVTNEPIWSVALEYRLKQIKWDTPESEDPIKYHAKRLGNKGGDWYIIKVGNDKYWYSDENAPVGVTLMDQTTAAKIRDALNEGKIRPKGE